ncbi:NADH-quinone oxidoreductase subunit C [Azospirillum sp. ST 5-10]|uniref:NADH-quinone oxidoreductase subunit C n=1 Tax=unclassified Azospirillum TaxID=2630922 RepID=UPI003F4A47A1
MTTRLPEDIEARLRVAAPGGIAFTADTDGNGVTVAWCELADKDDLVPVALALRALDARLSMIAGSQPPAPPEADEEEEAEGEPDGEGGAGAAGAVEPPRTFGGTPMDGTSYEMTYHFDLAGDTLTVVVFVAAGDFVDSLTPLFRTADWAEREIMETYALTVRGHPDPRRLFIDPSIDPAVLERLVPFSALVNATSTKELWARVMDTAKAGAA